MTPDERGRDVREPRSLRRPPRSVAVVIPTFNCAATLTAQLDALLGQSYRGAWDVLIADNGSTDGTVEVAQAWRGPIPLSVVDASDIRGAGHARNVGLATTGAEFVAFCDGDDVVTPEWLERLVAYSTQYDLVAGELESLVDDDPAGRSHAASGELRLAAGFLAFAPSGSFGAWADVLRDLGGFDVRYRRSQDIDLSWRAQLRGYQLGLAPGATVRYRYRSSAGSVFRQALGAGRAMRQLEVDFAEFGVCPRSAREALRRCLWLLARAPLLLRSERRLLWLRRFGEEVGRRRGPWGP